MLEMILSWLVIVVQRMKAMKKLKDLMKITMMLLKVTLMMKMMIQEMAVLHQDYSHFASSRASANSDPSQTVAGPLPLH